MLTQTNHNNTIDAQTTSNLIITIPIWRVRWGSDHKHDRYESHYATCQACDFDGQLTNCHIITEQRTFCLTKGPPGGCLAKHGRGGISPRHGVKGYSRIVPALIEHVINVGQTYWTLLLRCYIISYSLLWPLMVYCCIKPTLPRKQQYACLVTFPISSYLVTVIFLSLIVPPFLQRWNYFV